MSRRILHIRSDASSGNVENQMIRLSQDLRPVLIPINPKYWIPQMLKGAFR